MPAPVVKTKHQEELWTQAKKAARKQGQGKNWAYIMGVFKKSGGMNEASGHSVLKPLFKELLASYQAWLKRNPSDPSGERAEMASTVSAMRNMAASDPKAKNAAILVARAWKRFSHRGESEPAGDDTTLFSAIRNLGAAVGVRVPSTLIAESMYDSLVTPATTDTTLTEACTAAPWLSLDPQRILREATPSGSTKDKNDDHGFDDDDQDENDESVECDVCGGRGCAMGTLGNRKHYQCRNCGMQFSKHVNEGKEITGGPDSKTILNRCLSYLADLNGSDWIKGNGPGEKDMRQRAKGLQKAAINALESQDDIAATLDRCLSYLADLNSGNWIKGNGPGEVDMRQRAKGLQKAAHAASAKNESVNASAATGNSQRAHLAMVLRRVNEGISIDVPQFVKHLKPEDTQTALAAIDQADQCVKQGNLSAFTRLANQLSSTGQAGDAAVGKAMQSFAKTGRMDLVKSLTGTLRKAVDKNPKSRMKPVSGQGLTEDIDYQLTDSQAALLERLTANGRTLQEIIDSGVLDEGFANKLKKAALVGLTAGALLGGQGPAKTYDVSGKFLGGDARQSAQTKLADQRGDKFVVQQRDKAFQHPTAVSSMDQSDSITTTVKNLLTKQSVTKRTGLSVEAVSVKNAQTGLEVSVEIVGKVQAHSEAEAKAIVHSKMAAAVGQILPGTAMSDLYVEVGRSSAAQEAVGAMEFRFKAAFKVSKKA